MSGQTLSSLNRAALGGRDEWYLPIHLSAIAYTLLIGWFSVDAWASTGEPFRAATCGGAQVLAIVCAVLARRALTAQMPLAGGLGLAFAGGCAWWAAKGVQHAWESNGTDISPFMIYFLAALEPGLFLLAEHVKEGRAALRAAFERDEQEQAAELARVRQRERERDQMGAHGLSPVRLVSDAGRAVVAVGALAAPVGAHAAEPAAIVSEDTGHATARDHVEALRAGGLKSRTDIARKTGVPRSTVSRWCREWEQQQAEIEQQERAA